MVIISGSRGSFANEDSAGGPEDGHRPRYLHNHRPPEAQRSARTEQIDRAWEFGWGRRQWE